MSSTFTQSRLRQDRFALRSSFLVIGTATVCLLFFSTARSAAQDMTAAQTEKTMREVRADIVAGRWEQARSALEALATKMSGRAEFHFLRGWVLLHDKQLARGEEELNRAVVLEPNQARYLMVRGQMFERKRELESAQRDYRRAVELEPRNLEAVTLLIGFLIREHHSDEAFAVTTAALERIPGSPELQYSLGHVHEMLGRPERAVSAYERAVALNPRVALFHGRLGRLYRDTPERLPLSVTHLKRALEIEPRNAEWHYELGISLLRQQKLEEARGALEGAAALQPDARPTYTALAQVYGRMGLTEKAQEARERSARLLRQDEIKYTEFKRALELESAGKVSEAAELYQKILAEHPTPQIHYSLARLYLNARQPARAEGHIRAAIEKQSGDASYHLLYALVLLHLERPDEAEVQTRAAIELQPSDAELHHLLGNLLLERGKLDEAVAAYRRAAEISPGAASYRLSLATALQRKGDAPAAQRELEVYQKLTGQNGGRPEE